MIFVTIDSTACESWNLQEGSLVTKLKYPLVFESDMEIALVSYNNDTVLVNPDHNNIHILSSIVDNQLLAETSAQIVATLPVIPRTSTFLRELYSEILNVKWKRIVVQRIDKLILHFVTTNLQPAAFSSGNIALTLAFRPL